ncbi:MAG: SIMPL domain-containing protein [Chloroflexi bacterium]|nr:SIMPL domain-containing protein [Chloroflexota bacterium]
MNFERNSKLRRILPLMAILLAAALLAACSALPQSTSSGGVSSDVLPVVQHTISVSGRGTVSLVPDIVSLSIGVQTEGAVAADAVAANTARSEQVIEALGEFGVDSRDISTTNFSVFPIQNRGPNGEVINTTFRVQNTVNVTVRDLDNLGGILDAVVTAGANTISGIRFEANDISRRLAHDEALTDALVDARRQADLLADAAGVRVVDVLSISVSTFGEPLALVQTRALGGFGGGDVPISPGELDLTVEIFVVFEIALEAPEAPQPEPTAEPDTAPETSEE